MTANVMLWRLKPRGACGVGDHTRGMARNLGAEVRDFSTGQRDVDSDTVLQWVPSGWTETLGAATPLLDAVERARGEPVLFMHELWRGPLLRRGPRSGLQFVHDLLAVRVMLPRARRVLVTSGLRKVMLDAAAATMGLRVDVEVVHVASNVHDEDPPAPVMPPDDAPPTVVLFARAGGGVLADPLARALKVLRARRPDVRMVLLGERGHPANDAVTRALDEANVAHRMTTTGALPAHEVVAHLGRAHVGLSLHDTGVSGRRGTVAAMMASGVPVVTARGRETDAWWEACEGVVMPTHADHVDADALAESVVRLLDEDAEKKQARREAAHAFYMRHAAWSALAQTVAR